MDPNDALREHLAGELCPACSEPIGADGVNVLTQRSDVIFVHLLCGKCGTITLALVAVEKAEPDEKPDRIRLDEGPEGPEPTPEVMRWRLVANTTEMTADDLERLADSGPIDADDVLAMHELLEGWQGDLVGLLGDDRGRGPGGEGASA